MIVRSSFTGVIILKKRLVVNGGVLEEVEQFCFLGDVLDCEAGVERAVRARVTAAWRRWREMASLVMNRSIGLRTRGRVQYMKLV